MNEAVSRQTRETLGQVIRKPPLTDALLSKPPFRYLHDLITEVIRVTGFLRGLYTDFELKSDNVKDKDSKINFLQKAIDAVVMVTGEPLSVKPARVVAGHEPEKTNEFLQAIGKCCLNKLSSDAAVKRVLAGEKADAKGKPPPSKPRHKESREPKAEEQKSHKDKEVSRKDSEIKDRSPSRDRKPKGDLKESREREKERDKQKNNEERPKEPERDTSKEGEKQEREGGKSRTTKQGRETEKSRGKGDPERGEDLRHDKGQEREKRHEGGREKDRLKGRDKDKARDREVEKDRERRNRDREKDGEHLREHGKEKAEKKPSDSEESLHRKPQRPTKDSKCQPDTENETPARISKQPSVKASRHPSKPGGEGAVDTRSGADGISEDGAAELQEKNEPDLAEKQKEREVENAAPDKPENGEAPPDVPPRPAQRRIPRPGSARPAPPRVKHQESTELLTPERSGSAKAAPSMLREQQVSDEEDEQFVVETAGPLPDMPKEPEVELVEDQKHGGLVKRILETKKDYEASQKSSQTTDRISQVAAPWSTLCSAPTEVMGKAAFFQESKANISLGAS
ncbi:TRAF3-interacting protein 1 isoform X4 [Haemorhous mexicanus]|uniref:TRAF3-interacting protein 1 isoform X4 n=1 Tax=Haemorhous mexicanus TaxID=30427 RepID=UPI0028BD2B41|nr:TRAF3-interacting protein 1 isoform X4 [Haemorhous mexicanus]